ncbi:hypothetical protein ARMSODRAFT_1015281 [Armillaria solidipes]|uniref:Uncharacterized protein n=1 Tax=Armillaria solidipes TaxID=1076256 RepID=A0A2H3BVV1_9AGAR|nr:hypothetical protein ARMSODRAFT_1015281 [Armillaria solidipes]
MLADALSQLWSNESPGMVHGRGTYTYHDVVNNDSIEMHGVSMPVLVGVEAACLVLEGVGFDLNAMSLRSDRQPSVCARGLDNDIVPGKLIQQKSSMSSHRPWKEGEGATQNAPKPKPKPKFNPKPFPKSKTKATAVSENKAVEPVNTQDKVNVQDKVKLVKAILPSSSIKHQEPLTQPQSNDSEGSLEDMLANGSSKIDLTFVLQNHYAGDVLFRKILPRPKEF